MTEPAARPPARVGRPRRSSAGVLADAAAELFLEQGYAGTTVDDVARRAGVSRGTFFNYFDSKADTFWVEVDGTLARLPELLREPRGGSALEALGAALVAAAEGHDPAGVPWALTQGEAMRLGDDVVTSAATRVAAAQRLAAAHLQAGRWDGDGAGGAVAGPTVVSTAVAAFVAWSRGGVGRPPLVTVVGPPVGRVVGAFA